MNVEKRMREIAAEIAAITAFAEGSITCSRNYYRLKDGSRRQTTPHFKFTSKGARGRQTCVTVSAARIDRVRELVESGRRYRRLEAEYARLMTEKSLAATR